MGSGYTISCKECDYSKEFVLGIGMMYSPNNLEDFDSELALLPHLIRSKKTLTHIQELLADRKVMIRDDYGHEIYRCSKCGEFYGRFFLCLEYDGGIYEVEYKCSKCRIPIKPVGNEDPDSGDWIIDLRKYPCPKCGKHSLYENPAAELLWD